MRDVVLYLTRAEPKDYEIYNFILNHYYDLRFSPAVDAVIKTEKKNTKRIQRNIKKKMQILGLEQSPNRRKRLFFLCWEGEI